MTYVHGTSLSLFIAPVVSAYLHRNYMLRYEPQSRGHMMMPQYSARVVCYANDRRTSDDTQQQLLNKYCVAAFKVIR